MRSGSSLHDLALALSPLECQVYRTGAWTTAAPSGGRTTGWLTRSRRRSSPPPASAPGSSPRPRPSPRRWWPWSTSRPSSTWSRRPRQNGITDILIITGRGKGSLEDHFDRSFELEYRLEQSRQARAAGRAAGHRRPGHHALCAPGRAARARPCRVDGPGPRRRRALRGHAPRRHHAREVRDPGGMLAAHERHGALGAGPEEGHARRDLVVRERRRRGRRTNRWSGSTTWSRSPARRRRPRTWASWAATC